MHCISHGIAHDIMQAAIIPSKMNTRHLYYMYKNYLYAQILNSIANMSTVIYLVYSITICKLIYYPISQLRY